MEDNTLNDHNNDSYLHRGFYGKPKEATDAIKKDFKHGCCKLDVFDWLKTYDRPHQAKELLIAEIRFKNGRKDFYSYTAEMQLEEGDIVVVEAAIGHDIGVVSLVGALISTQMKRKKIDQPVEALKKICRHARVNDIEKWFSAIDLEYAALYRSRDIAIDLKLDMKMNDIEYQGDKSKAIFYYTAESRVDFRELIKKLAEEFHIRIEMRQIGVRQEAAKLGGIGSCGRELCCSSWISDFQSVTTSVAHVQQLSPNPQKLAGQCGKLKCCLNYEYETYANALKEFPDNRIVLKTKKGDAFHQKSDIFKGLMWYSYRNDRANIMAIPVNQVKAIMAQNAKGQYPDKLEDFAHSQEQHAENYGESEVDLRSYE
ncbi:MAG: hypothetical protein LBM67_05905 [Lentimicrobiaceae bacterium]|jgi:cell fate regulator YaaT (PSP1 superfamily)|nr:hypothetical protein [Lentimicrobiaceae bacterium]